MENVEPTNSHDELLAANDEYLLVIAAQAGEHLAFEKLYERYAPRVARSIARVLVNPSDREDALQDCFLRAYRGLHGFRFRSSFSTWLTRIGINSALMILRKLRARREDQTHTIVTLQDNSVDVDFIDHALDPEARYIEIDLRRHLQLAVTNLPPGMRAALELRNRPHATVDDISRALNVSVPAVKSRLHRGRILLQKRISSNALTY